MQVAAQGRRHSVFGRGQVDGGLVLDMTGLDQVTQVSDDRAVVGAGATWRELLDVTMARGLAPPVLPDYLDLSIGGTVVIGGVGARTPAAGVVTDHVLALEVVTGAGDRMRCSPREHRDLFDAVRAGLGQVAVITSGTLALAPAPRSVRSTVLEHEDLTTMVTGISALIRERRVDVAQGAIVARPTGGWAFRTTTAVFDTEDGGGHVAPVDQQTTTYTDFLDRLSGFEAELRAAGQWELPHPWLTTLVGDHAVASALSEELADLSSHDLGPAGQIVVNPVLPETVRTPLVQVPAGSLCFTVNLIRVPASDDPDQVGRLLEANRAIYERLRARGGTLYPASALQMSSTDWRRHFGPAFERLHDARRTYDPDGLLTPGYEVFPKRR